MSITSLNTYAAQNTSPATTVAGVSAYAATSAVANVKSPGQAQAKAGQQVAPAISQADLEAAVKKLNEHVSPVLQQVEFSFSVDKESDRIIVKVVDKETKKVLRQIPNEEVMAFSKTLDRLQGLVIKQTA